MKPRPLPFIGLLVGLLGLQLALVGTAFPLTELWTEKPLFHNDAAFHWYQMTAAVHYARSGTLVGYDPYFGAGYPGGVTHNWSAKVPALAALLLQPAVSEAVIYKAYAFLCGLLGPLCIALALRLWGWNFSVTLAGSALGLVLWWASMFRWFHTAGMVSFVFGSYAAVAWSALLARALEARWRWRGTVGVGLLGAFLFFLHPHFPLNVALPLVVVLAARWPALEARRTLRVLLVVGLTAMIPNLGWLIPMAEHLRGFVLGAGDPAPYQKIVDGHVIWREALGIWRDHAHGTFLNPILVAAATWGCFAAPPGAERRLGRALAAGWLASVVFAAFGGALGPLGHLQPNRFGVFGYLLLCAPAALGIRALVAQAGGAATGRLRLVAISGVAGLLLVAAYAANEVRREVSWSDVGHYGTRPPEVRGVGPVSSWLLDWLTTETTPEGRVMFEESRGRIYDGCHIAGFLAYRSQRQFLGGPYPFQHFAGFWDGFAFGRPLSEIPADAFLHYLDLYNVGWIVAHSEVSQRYFAGFPELIEVARSDKLRTYRVQRPLSYFLEGSGRVEQARHNRLVLSDLSGERVVIKYHFVSGLRAEPATTIVPVRLMDDPNPFVGLVAPPDHLVLSVR